MEKGVENGNWEWGTRIGEWGMRNGEWEWLQKSKSRILVVLLQCKYLNRNGEWKGEWRMGIEKGNEEWEWGMRMGNGELGMS